MDDQNILQDLLSLGESGNHTKFELLRNWQEYRDMRKVRYARKVALRYLQELSDNQLKNYCKAVSAGASDVCKLFAYTYITKVIAFYAEELRITEDMLDEYETYLLSGNLIDFIFNLQRPSDKLWDHRGA